MQSLVLNIPAKINLSLDITGKREDGYHTLRSVFQTVGIYDRLTVTKTDAGEPVTLTCDTAGIPTDRRNLVLRAVEALLGENPCGFTMHLQKRIPSQAGMGGGSADCAAALLAIRQMFLPELPDAVLHEKAATLGADVPFFLKGGTALCEGIGDLVTPLMPMPKRILVIAKGTEGISTPAAYRAFDALPGSPPKHTVRVLPLLYAADAMRLFSACGNHFDLVTKLPEVEQIRRVMRSYQVNPVLSGSGAAVFGGCRSKAQAEELAAALRAAGIAYVAVCSTHSGGITALSVTSADGRNAPAAP